MNEMARRNPVLDHSFDFALLIIEFADLLEKDRKFVMARQLYKSGTSIGANVQEAQEAESRSDFIHKLKIANKEARETEYWLQLCQNSTGYPNPTHLIQKLHEIKRLLNSIIITSKRNQK